MSEHGNFLNKHVHMYFTFIIEIHVWVFDFQYVASHPRLIVWIVLYLFFQLAVFGFSRSSHVEFLEKTTTTFRNLYMENWGPAYETMPYPPSAGPFSVYTIENFYSSVNYAMKKVCSPIFIIRHPSLDWMLAIFALSVRNGCQLFSNLADWCHVSSSAYLKADMQCADIRCRTEI